MRLLKILSLFALVVAAIFYVWRKPVPAAFHPDESPAHETTQLSKIPEAKAEPAKPVIIMKKAIGDDLPVKNGGVPFVQRHKLDGQPGNDSSPMERYRGLKLSEEVKVNGRPQFVLGARAVPTPKYNSSFGPVLFEKNGYSIVGLNTDADASWQQGPMHEGDRPVVVNTSNGRLGIVTGTLMIKFSDLHQADKLAGRENLQLLDTDESIGVGYFRAPENYPLLSAVDRLKNQPDVLRVELEVVEAFKGAW